MEQSRGCKNITGSLRAPALPRILGRGRPQIGKAGSQPAQPWKCFSQERRGRKDQEKKPQAVTGFRCQVPVKRFSYEHNDAAGNCNGGTALQQIKKQRFCHLLFSFPAMR